MTTRLLSAVLCLLVGGVPPPHARSPSPPPPSLAASVEPAVRQFLHAHEEPCDRLGAGVLCFPVAVVAVRDRYAVSDVFKDLEPSRPYPPRSVYGTPVSGGAFDAVCAVRSAWRQVRRSNDTWYVYRVWDEHGERAVLSETPLASGRNLGVPEFQFELVAKVRGPCAAENAWRRADREVRGRLQASR